MKKQNFQILNKLNLADLTTLLGLMPIVVAFYFASINKPFESIIAICLAFTFDILDGYLARKLRVSSKLGRQLDSFADAFNYLAFTSFFLYKFLNINTLITFLLIFTILTTGVLRLARHNIQGLSSDDNDTFYYQGLIVPYIQLATITIFFLTIYFSENIIYLVVSLLLILSLLMISDFKIKKIKNYYFIFGLISLFIFLAIKNIF